MRIGLWDYQQCLLAGTSQEVKEDLADRLTLLTGLEFKHYNPSDDNSIASAEIHLETAEFGELMLTLSKHFDTMVRTQNNLTWVWLDKIGRHFRDA